MPDAELVPESEIGMSGEDWVYFLLTSPEVRGKWVVFPEEQASPDAFWRYDSEATH